MPHRPRYSTLSHSATDRRIAMHFAERQSQGDVDDVWEDDDGYIYVFDVSAHEVDVWPELRHVFRLAFRDTADGWEEVEVPTEED